MMNLGKVLGIQEEFRRRFGRNAKKIKDITRD
jgi:hypothetical protein